jgi:hypothetical protein
VPMKNAPAKTTFEGHAVHREEKSDKDLDEDYFLPPNSHKFIKVTFDLTTIPPDLSKHDFEGDCMIHFETTEFHPHGKRRSARKVAAPPDAKVPCQQLSVVRVKDN